MITTDEFEIRVAAGVPCGKRLGVALSGGADSVALLAALTACGFTCRALHCNFHLRGEESDRDQAHAESIARQLGAECSVVHFDVRSRCEATGESVEMACRELRYEWFYRMASEYDLDAVAVGHHADDRVETFFLNLLRSTGLRGLSALRSQRDIFVRPMLSLTREDITDYLARRGLPYITDSSNASDIYKRNRIRHHIVPALEEQFPDYRSRILSTMDNLCATDALLTSLVKRQAATYLDEDGAINLARLRAEEPLAAEFLFEMLRTLFPEHRLPMATVNDIIGSAENSGRRFGSWITDHGMLRLYPEERAERCEIVSPGSGQLEWCVLPREQFRPERDPSTAWFDASILDGNPVFELRSWRKADRMRPFGLRGTKAVSDIFSDMKFSVARKDATDILTRDGQIIWIPGVKNSALFPVTDDSERVLRLRMIF